MYIDHSVYPDENEPPEELLSINAKADYVHRIASAWDFGASVITSNPANEYHPKTGQWGP